MVIPRLVNAREYGAGAPTPLPCVARPPRPHDTRLAKLGTTSRRNAGGDDTRHAVQPHTF